MKILISGGHLTPALALIDFIKEEHPNDTVVFAGREYSQERTKQLSKERSETEKRGAKFIAFTSGKFEEWNPISLFFSGLSCIKAFFHACSIILSEKPSIYVSFGSYLAAPLAFACWILHVPVITHEQTRTLGIANKMIAPIAKVVAVSYPQVQSLLLPSKTEFTGNLLRKQLSVKNPKKPAWITKAIDKPVLYITGGSQGSEIINTVTGQSLARLCKDWFVIHQCGGNSAQRSYTQELEQMRDQLRPQLRFSYVVREWVNVEELAWIYKNATALVSRSGANTTQEIAFFNIPSVLIPLPFSHRNEQVLNAQWLTEVGGAILIHQKDLTPDSLVAALTKVKDNHAIYQKKLMTLDIPMDADRKLYALIEKFARS